MTRRLAGSLAVLAALALPAPAAAQLGAIEAFARRVSDLSFYGGLGGGLPESERLEGGFPDVASWGVELLFEVGTIEEPIGSPPPPADSVVLRWTEMRVVRSGGRADTTYLYEVAPVRPVVPTRPVWTFELGIGYGQLVGFEAADPSLDLRGAVRNLPAVSLYASYEPLGSYFGLRSGFMRLDGLQAIDADGRVWRGGAESFLAGALAGHAVEVLGLFAFAEAAYTLRYFPSVEWSGGPLPPALPRDLQLSGWSLSLGIQFDVGQ